MPQSAYPGRNQNISVSATLAGAETPNLIARFAGSGYFDAVPSLDRPAAPGTSQRLPNPFELDTGLSVSRLSPLSQFPPALRSSRKRSDPPFQIRKKALPARPAGSDELEHIAAEISGLPTHISLAAYSHPTKPPAIIPLKDGHAPSPTFAQPFRIIEPSLPTLEKAMSIALYFEQFYHALLKPATASKPAHPGNYLLNRARRLANLEIEFALPENRFMSDAEKTERRDGMVKEENRILRERRRRVGAQAFEMGRVIGHGAFGVVRIARERQTGRLVAMKQVSGPPCTLAR
jgi:hypothetical protein